MTSLLDVISQVGAVAPNPFLAPFPESGVGKVLTVQNDVPFWLEVENQKAGWWHVLPKSRMDGFQLEVARFHERAEYLEQLPAYRILTLYPVGRSTWLCSPLNAADAAQRGWPDAVPRLLHLVDLPSDRAFWLEPIFARDLAGCLLYERPGGGTWARPHLQAVREWLAAGESAHDIGYSLNSDLARAAALVEAHVRRLRKAEEERRAKNAKQEKESTVRRDLAFMGAELVSWEGGKVSYEYNGVVHKVEIDPSRQVTSAGICLSGTDGRHDLTSVVAVLEEARRLHRFDMEEEKWL